MFYPGGSSPPESWFVWDFDDTAVENLDFHCVLAPTYSGGGVTGGVIWGRAVGTSAVNCIWEIAFRAIVDDVTDTDNSFTYDFNQVTASAPGAVGRFVYDAIPFTNGADMDSVGAGMAFVARIRRNGGTLTGDARLRDFTLRET
jgi:hypothetical protein